MLGLWLVAGWGLMGWEWMGVMEAYQTFPKRDASEPGSIRVSWRKTGV